MAEVVKNYSDIIDGVEKSLCERGKITNRRGNVVTPRKYHMADAQTEKAFKRWQEHIFEVSTEIKHKASAIFFNPYRENGAYYGGVQALYLLGANEWHGYGAVRGKMQEDMSTRSSPTNRKNSWDKFACRSAREGAASTKDLMGRIVQNFRTLQRLGGVHPYGWKLKELQTSVDIRRQADGIWEFRLNTSWDAVDSVVPFYDVSAYTGGLKKGPRGTKAVDGKVITSVEVDTGVAV
jgi:hypothetical protein